MLSAHASGWERGKESERRLRRRRKTYRIRKHTPEGWALDKSITTIVVTGYLRALPALKLDNSNDLSINAYRLSALSIVS